MQLSLTRSTPKPQTLRPYQTVSLEALRAHVRAGHQRVLLVSPTGSGKTTIASAMIGSAIAKQKKVLFLAHRKELIDQCSARLDEHGIDHGVIMAGHKRIAPWAPVQVASIPTLVNRLKKGQKPPADLIVLDEAHHARASTYMSTMDAYPGVPVIGLTATPWRTDGRGLGHDGMFSELVVAARPHELIDEGFLVPCTGFAYDTPDLSAVRKVAGDYNEGDLDREMRKSKIMGSIIDAYLNHAAGKRAVVFCVSVQHSKDLAEQFRAAGVPAKHISGITDTENREQALAELKAGTIHVVTNCAVLTEGWDMPEVEVCILARPTLSTGLYLQMVGRVLRPVPCDCGLIYHWREPACPQCGKRTPKQRARLHDHAGNALRHGLPDDDRDYDLQGDTWDKKADAKKVESVRTCEKCYCVYSPRLPECPQCGYANPSKAAVPVYVEGVEIALEDLARGPRKFLRETPEQRRVRFDEWAAQARSRGYKPGWVAYRFKEAYGAWPPWTWTKELEAKALSPEPEPFADVARWR